MAMQQISVKVMPAGVKVISVLYYIGAGLCALFGLLFMAGAGLAGALLKSISLLSVLGAGFFVILGILFVGFGALDFFVGRGLWKGRNWARVVAIIFSALGVLNGLYSLIHFSIFGLVMLAIQVLIVWYLAFSQEVKAAFA